MGIKDWWRNRQAASRKKKELVALDHLRRVLEREKKRLGPIEAVVAEIEVKVNEGKFQEAEKFIPNLVSLMKEKKILDKAEEQEFKKFKKTMFKELKAELKGVK